MKTGVILDTDIGNDPDDLFALLLLLNSPEIKLDLIITGDEVKGKRAAFTKNILDIYERKDLKIVQGEDLGNTDFVVDELISDAQYSFDKNYIDAAKKVFDNSDKVVYIGIQGFTNLANILKNIPDSKEKMAIYQMGGSVDYSRRPGWVEHNVKMDVEAARYVLNSGANVSLIMAQTTFNPVFMIDDQHEIFKKLKADNRPAYKMLARHCELFHEAKSFWPYMHDPLTVSAAMGKNFVSFYESGISMDKEGNIYLSSNQPKLPLSRPDSKDRKFMQFLYNRLFISI